MAFSNFELFEGSEFDDYTKYGIIANDNVIVGITSFAEKKYNNIELLKIDTTGKIERRITPNLPGTIRIKDILYSTDNKEFYIIGSSTHLEHTYFRSWIISLSDSLIPKWRQQYKGLESTEVQASTITNKSHIILAGLTKESKSSTNPKLWLAQIDNNGNEMWKKNIAFSNSTFEVTKVLAPNEKEIVVCGNILDAHKPFIAKFNKTGEFIMKPMHYMYDHQETKVNDFTIDIEGNYIMVGRTSKNNSRNIWICKIDSNGTQIRSEIYSNSPTDDALSILVTENNEYIISGCTESTKNKNNGFILKSTSNIEFSSFDEIEYLGDDVIYHSIYLNNGKCLFMGKSNGNNENFKKDNDAWIFTRDI